MRSLSLYRMSGQCLMYAGLLWAVSLVIEPPGPAATLAEVTSRLGVRWTVSGLLGILAVVLATVAIIGVYRHFQDGEQEGWALVSLSANVAALVAGLVGGIFWTLGLPMLVSFANGAPEPATYEPARAAILAVTIGAHTVSSALLWLSLLPLTIAMLRDRVWPRAIAWSALVCGIVEAGGPFVLRGNTTARHLLMLLGFAFLVVLGGTIARLGRAPKEVATAPPAETSAGA
jgi:hypothetical protein